MCLSFFQNRITPRIENIASKEINQFIQILINHTSFTQKIDTHKLYKKENNSISFQMNYINDIASNYINNLDPKAFVTVYTVADMRYQLKVLENEERS